MQKNVEESKRALHLGERELGVFDKSMKKHSLT